MMLIFVHYYGVLNDGVSSNGFVVIAGCHIYCPVAVFFSEFYPRTSQHGADIVSEKNDGARRCVSAATGPFYYLIIFEIVIIAVFGSERGVCTILGV